MIKELIKIATRLDSLGLTREADQVDLIIRKISSMKEELSEDPRVALGQELDRDMQAYFESKSFSRLTDSRAHLYVAKEHLDDLLNKYIMRAELELSLPRGGLDELNEMIAERTMVSFDIESLILAYREAVDIFKGFIRLRK